MSFIPIFVIDRNAGTMTVTMDPTMMRFISLHLPAHDLVTYEWRAQLAMLEQTMGGNDNRRCPGSGKKGEHDGALLSCPVCKRLIGAWPPDELPLHDSPIFDDGKEVL
jgi:hypothetical protein